MFYLAAEFQFLVSSLSMTSAVFVNMQLEGYVSAEMTLFPMQFCLKIRLKW